MDLIEKIAKMRLGQFNNKPKVKYCAFEDNKGALELAMVPNIQQRTRHINIKYHHFCAAVRTGIIVVCLVDTKEQIADIFTKPLDKKKKLYLRRKLMGW